jgi:electron transfer flavoprotein alpha subunit
MSVLVYAEHDNASLKDATLAVVTAAAKLGDVHVLVAGNGCSAVADANQLAENVAPLVSGLMAGYDAALFPATAHGKNIAPRVAASLDVMQISDILSVESADTFTRPIYAGNAIATVQSSDAKKVITVRGTAFAKAEAEGGSASVEATQASPASSGRKSPSWSAPN